MRITTQMLNESARKAGIHSSRMTLLDTLKGDDNTMGNALLQALNKSKTSNTSALNSTRNISPVNKARSAQLQKAAETLTKAAQNLAAEGENSIFVKARESGEAKEVYDEIELLVEGYNDTINKLQKDTNGLNQFYLEQLKKLPSDNRASLETVGITVGKDGMLSLDKEKMKASSVEDLEKIFGKEGPLTSKIAFLSERTADNARAVTESTSSQYTSAGDIYSALLNKYDFRG